ncbi:MAG: SDR family NAD(P)-dependent oxidoreductase, partial [Alicyclobacillus sp.]|nr:SDR family NAD(P)-dependent oxidoreductase [Alicyclobacillus sp.]
MRFAQQVVIVTGSGQGIGRAYAKAFAREGAHVVIAEFNAEKGAAVEREIREAGGLARFIPVDVGDPVSVRQLVE